MLLQTQVQGKPYKSTEAEEQRFTEPDVHESNQTIQNETLVARGKREVIHDLTSLCNTANYAVSKGPPSTNGCVKRWYYCRGYKEAECLPYSFACKNNRKYGFLKCTEVYGKIVTIANRKVRIRTGCQCAQ